MVLALMRRHLLRHGVLGMGDATIPALGETEKYQIIPLIFALMPAAGVTDRSYDTKIKPLIRRHLESMNVCYDDELVSIVKSLCDQYFSTSFDQRRIRGIKKLSIADLRVHGQYSQIAKRQYYRCGICGLNFKDGGTETLDHIVPWRLIGDVPDGSNWQILCLECNNGKSNLFSSLMARDALNWIYSAESRNGETPSDSTTPGIYDGRSSSFVSNRLRYIVLARDERCTEPGCFADAKSSRLFVEQIHPTGLTLYDFLATKCSKHRPSPKTGMSPVNIWVE
jgi:5-methylcytosine-specific restriction endonuclease McrA